MIRTLGFIVTVLVLFSSFATANTIQPFNATGVFEDGYNVTGTVNIDTTIGTITSIDLFSHGFEFTYFDQGPLSQWPAYSLFAVTDPSFNVLPYLGLQISGTSLVGYNGGPLCSPAYWCTYDPDDSFLVSAFLWGDPNNPTVAFLLNGSLSKATPEPATLALLLPAALAIFRRKQI